MWCHYIKKFGEEIDIFIKAVTALKCPRQGISCHTANLQIYQFLNQAFHSSFVMKRNFEEQEIKFKVNTEILHEVLAHKGLRLKNSSGAIHTEQCTGPVILKIIFNIS